MLHRGWSVDPPRLNSGALCRHDGSHLKQRFWIKSIAVWQMTGGALGGVYLLDAISRLKVAADLRLALFAIVVPICALSLLSGWALLHQRRAARLPSLIVHAVQLIGFGTPAL